jgi:tRNA(Ile)-lysidine synthase
MPPAVDALAARVRATGLLPTGSPVVVLLSGGRDSVALLDLAVLACGPGAVSALHVNYGLRPESSGDEASCAELCRRLDVALETEHVAAPAGAGNLQAWARDVRYGAGVRVAAARGAQLAAAHTTTDQAETILYRLAASPGRRALLGMPERRGLLIRPLLAAGISREETGAWCAARGLSWVDDASNASDAFMRGRVRTRALPALRELHPAAEANLLRTSELLRDEAEVLDVVIETALAGRDRIELGHLAALPLAVARLVVRRLAEDAAGGLCPRAAGRLPELLALGAGGGTAMLDVGDGARAVADAGVLRFERTPPREQPIGRAKP